MNNKSKKKSYVTKGNHNKNKKSNTCTKRMRNYKDTRREQGIIEQRKRKKKDDRENSKENEAGNGAKRKYIKQQTLRV